MRSFFHDLRYALRTLRGQPGFTTVALLALALGIGASTAIFSAVSAVLLHPLPYPTGDRLVRIWETFPPQFGKGSVSGPNFDDWRAQNTTFEELAGISYTDVSVAGGEGRAAERLNGAAVTSGFFPVLAVAPTVGRAFAAEEYQSGNEHEVILTHDLWQRRFNGEPDVIGRKLTLSGEPYVVVGILPRGFRWVGLPKLDVVLPLAHGSARWAPRDRHWMQVIGLLKPGVTPEKAQVDMTAVAARITAAYPEAQAGRGVYLQSLHETLVGRMRPALVAFLGAVLLVLLIACANVANMLLARAAARRQEISVRVALGASRARLVRQLLTESLLLAVLGGGLGLLVAMWGVYLLGAVQQHEVPGAAAISLDGVTLGFAALVTLGSVVLFGLVPALRGSRVDLQSALKESSRTTTGGGQRLRSLLVVGQVALSLSLLVCAGLLLRSFVGLMNVPLGFDPDHVLTAEINLSKAGYGEDAQIGTFYQRLVERAQAIPGVTSAGVVDFLPLSGNNMNGSFRLEGQEFPPGKQPVTEYMIASPDLFKVLGMRIVAGRAFTAADGPDAPKVTVINQTMAKRYFPGVDPIGKKLGIWGDNDWFTIVGVVADSRRAGLVDDVRVESYTPIAQTPYASMAIALRTSVDPQSVAGALRRELQSLDPTQALFDVMTLDTVVSDAVTQRRFAMLLIATLAGLALILAGLGIYSVMSVQVTQRTRELGIRMALGAQQADVRRMVVRHGLVLAGGGVLVGVAGAALLSTVFTALLYGVGTLDPLTYGGVVVLLVAVAWLASWLPARRATRIDPMVALRS